MRTNQRFLLGLLVLGPAVTVPATVHAAGANKCVDANGNITLTDVPCHTVPTRPVPPPAGQARPPETLTPPKPEPILPPPEQRLPSPPAPLPATRPTTPSAPPTPPTPAAPLQPRP